MSKATREGQSDARTWMGENPRSSWADAILPGTLGADEALINALGVDAAAKLLGIQHPYVNGELTTKAYEAFRAYARAWTATVEQELNAPKPKLSVCQINAIVRAADGRNVYLIRTRLDEEIVQRITRARTKGRETEVRSLATGNWIPVLPERGDRLEVR